MKKSKNNVLDKFGTLTPDVLLTELKDEVEEYIELLDGIYKSQFGIPAEPMSSWSKLVMNKYLLCETVESCLCDIHRLKFFRGIHNEDSHKTAAFLVTWIVKTKPIQFIQGAIPHLQQELLVNELFAVYVAFNILKISSRDMYDKIPSYFRNLLYLWHFRPVYPEQLVSELFLLEQCIKGM